MKKFTNSNVATQLPSKFSKTTITRSPDTKLRDLLNKDGSLTTNNSLGILESYVTQCLDISRISYDEIKNSLLDKNFIECISLFQTSDFQSCAHPSGSISHAGSSDSLYENFKTIFANAMSHGSEICNNESLLSFELSHCDSSLFIPSPNGVSAVPRPAAVSRKRLNLYRNVGRLIGIALREKTQTVFNFSRHVFKYLLGHRLEFHDLAFHDREVYNALSGIMNQHKEGLDGFDIESLGLNFTCELSKGEGSGLMLLCENGDKTPVTSKNFKLFLELYCLHRMIYLVEPALVEMKKGLNETIPHGLLDFLSPVDLQLLLVCTSSIDVDLLIKSITFRDESKQSHATIERYKIWFVSLLKKFPQNKIKSL
ncbi:MAG: E3 ubiquitin-protein ligase ubr5, partial [Marteilia pararefringens]